MASRLWQLVTDRSYRDPANVTTSAVTRTAGTADEPQIDLARFAVGGAKRVRIVTPTFDPEPVGTPLYAGELARWLVASGWDVDIVTGQPHYPRYRRYEGYGRERRRDVVDAISVFRLPTLVPKQGSAPWRALCDTNFLLQGYLARRRLSPSPLTIVITPGVPFAIPVARRLTSRGGTVVAWVHDLQSGLAAALGAGPLIVRGSAAVERLCLNLADHVLTLSDGMARRVGELGVHRPTSTFGLWSTLSPDNGRRVTQQADVLYSGNIGRKQGCVQLLDLAEQLHQRRPGTTLLIRADAYARRDLESDAARRGLTNVLFAGLVPHAELRQGLRSARVYVIPQAPDVGDNVLPSKAVNALAAGCLVVAAGEPGSAVAGLAETNPSMLLTPPGDVQSMTDAVLSLLAS